MRRPRSHRCAVNVAPFQLGQEVLGVHFTRLHEALVTTSLYLDARDLKSARNISKQPFSGA